VSANNHHAAFYPTTVNIFRKMAISLAISAILSIVTSFLNTSKLDIYPYILVESEVARKLLFRSEMSNDEK